MSDPFEQAINAHLQAFQSDPAACMDAQPQKYDGSGAEPAAPVSAFAPEDVEREDFIGARDPLRSDLLSARAASVARSGAEAAIAANDRPEALVDSFRYATLEGMERDGMMSARLPGSPWSDDYWALYKGVLGCRYADPAFPSSHDWKENFDYRQANPPGRVLDAGDATAIARLSPSEKYDALVGDSFFTLTDRMWSEGRYYYERHGSVERWMGICHGWAPAAYMLDRPANAVEVVATDGKRLTFYPSDVKALASLLWANVRVPTRFIGGRCNVQDPARDPQTGRVIAAQCFDTNPASWHMAMVNQVGASGRSLVLDATFDYQVWNQPALSYEYRYFNPERMVYVRTLEEARTPRSAFANDRFAAYRSPSAASVVGIAMDVSYVVETAPSHAETDDPSRDGIQRVRYFYDLELDASGVPIGGEWYTNKHPDFLWTPPPGARAVTIAEAMATGDWALGAPLPASWAHAGRQAAAMSRAPLAAIVERLIALSAGGAA